ncbi:methyl-accepting chemotaxis protein [Alkalihalobacillus alcalophilus ATCC 27647 = CGMCC 1.3604]|uniref:Chemotaxis protein n=1 Tax=Alkalihalobacillus alcalophilus ATCC 27647 = CGMCC 1.3604 TaxID=1218173 RepID=A0A094WMI9_ALKAL|nr:methyl-accepting chemotaxis protein [Alkalihalobacillus alcalophilus]KGA98974.1 chemotaxis protein [Alkalihalobacillus alcalophilus ATCC 27647 = CGMCC 1.3604]MED1562015.1 methyl-accepting chemotaxis protein [Alkalihalobacillus alcalophilus]THG89211.1 methyl-accepting chemotaxis protein [Alkalihalobacillus alcalophilus ATCC 27647 = CGMCC 1.3604]
MNNIANLEIEDDVLSAFVKVAPLLNNLIQDDITVGIYDTEKLLVNIPGKTFSLDVRSGDPLVEGDIVTNAIRNKTQLSAVLPKELFGFPLIARAIPLHNKEGKVVGGVGIGTSLEKANKLFEMAESFSAIVEQTAASIEDITDSVMKLSERVTSITGQMKDVSSSAEEIGQISSVVKGISDQSNLLGLNAAIEAARAGEVGKGFSVVASEIRKLASNSKENVDQINAITQNIQELLRALNGAFTEIHSLTDTQTGSIQEFSATIQEINHQAQELAQLAESTMLTDEDKK